MKGVGERLSKLRKLRKLTQEDAAQQMGIVRSTYSNYEAEKREPDFDTLRKMADFYEVTVDYLIGEQKRIISEKTRNEAMEIYNRLPQEKKKLIDDMIKALDEERR